MFERISTKGAQIMSHMTKTLPQKQKFHHERDDVARNHFSLQVCSSLV